MICFGTLPICIKHLIALVILKDYTLFFSGIVRNATTFFKISHQKVILEFLRDNDYYKPKMQYIGHVSLNSKLGLILCCF